jgi:LmbE family N-acetylglucosaminyl deacetylase
MARLAATGKSPEVWTFFTQGPESSQIPSRFQRFGDYITRHAEDEKALTRLGARSHWLGFQERLFNSPPLQNLRDLFSTPSILAGFPHLHAMEQHIAELLERPDLQIYAPLGIGNHFDHVELTVAALRVMLRHRAYGRFFFYEDYYAGDALARRDHFLSRRWCWNLVQGPAWASPRVGVILRTIAWARHGPSIETYVPEVTELEWQSIVEPVGSFESLKMQALEEYRSQTEELGGFNNLKDFLHRLIMAHGGERFWRCQPSRGFR